MALFGMKRRDDVIDLTERFKKQQAQAEDIRSETHDETKEVPKSSGFNPFPAFFGGANTVKKEESNDDDYINVSSGMSESGEEKRRKLAKRLMDMTKKMEELDNKIYHLQQRIEVLERKGENSGIGF